jgi:Xaa-Pro aminopeptidase
LVNGQSIRLEDVVVIGEDNYTNLTTTPTQLYLPCANS